LLPVDTKCGTVRSDHEILQPKPDPENEDKQKLILDQ
jgi:hypothetical protein